MKRAPLSITEDKVMRDLEEIRVAALEAGAFAPAIRAIELQGKHIGLWHGGTDVPPLSLLDLFALMPSLKKEEEQ
ncbi:MAG: hypothetical protein ACHQK9_14355 [Reyranellales bacterium]